MVFFSFNDVIGFLMVDSISDMLFCGYLDVFFVFVLDSYV